MKVDANTATPRRYGLTQLQETPCDAVRRRWQRRRRSLAAQGAGRGAQHTTLRAAGPY